MVKVRLSSNAFQSSQSTQSKTSKVIICIRSGSHRLQEAVLAQPKAAPLALVVIFDLLTCAHCERFRAYSDELNAFITQLVSSFSGALLLLAAATHCMTQCSTLSLGLTWGWAGGQLLAGNI